MSAPEILLIGGGKPLRKLLVAGGYKVIQVPDASEEKYLQKLTGLHPDLVIFDWPAADRPVTDRPLAPASGHDLLKNSGMSTTGRSSCFPRRMERMIL